jgi:flagellar biosynthesis/type III secretory pathway M-ring protein FliF/YscJ
MSDTTKLVLAIVVAVIVVAVIISLVLSARKRRETEHRRFEAGELRAKVEQQAPVLRENDDRASVTGEIAASARSEADAAARGG